MSGFNRQPSPAMLEAARQGSVVRQFVAAPVIAAVMRAQDPFGCDDPCPFNPTGHVFIGSCSDVVCCHCSKVAWQ